MPLSDWEKLFALSDKYGFVIASDECYSEIYFREEAPLGGLEAAAKLGRSDFKKLVAFTSLSKRSNVPGMRSGFVAGDASIIKQFLLYRTYHGSAMSGMVQAASIAAWDDEAHVVANREQYRHKFAAVTPLLEAVMDVRLPDAGFYLWAAACVPAAPIAISTALAAFVAAAFAVAAVFAAVAAAWTVLAAVLAAFTAVAVAVAFAAAEVVALLNASAAFSAATIAAC
jgi:N-succinyldiaminopimelate aminotransferase